MELEKENSVQNFNQIINNSIKNNNENNLDVNLKNEIDNKMNYITTVEKQNDFLETTLGKTINTAINVGLKFLLPNIIEDQVIEIKDTIIKDGFKEGLNKTISSAIDLGKSATGLLTGKFENVSQMQSAVQKGGLIDTVSNCIDFGLKVGRQTGVIPQNVANIIKSGKNILMNNIETNIENTLTTQLKGIEKLNKYRRKFCKNRVRI